MALTQTGPASGVRPNCWGRPDVYDNQDRECRGCGFQASCRDNVVRAIAAQQPAVPQMPSPQPMNMPSFYQNHLTPPQHAAPPAPFATVPFNPSQPIQVTNFRPPVPVNQPPPMFAAPQQFMQPKPVPVVPQVVQPVPTQQPLPPVNPNQHRVTDWYGRVQDPLHFALFQPPPYRPQMDGETFGQRVAKNILLDAGTLLLFHLALALRQMVLPPTVTMAPTPKVVNPK